MNILPERFELALACSDSIYDLVIRTKGRRSASKEQIQQLRHFAKQGVKVRLK